MGWHPTHTDQISWNGQPVNTTTFLDDPNNRVGVIVEQIDGLIEQPSFRLTDTDRPGQDGGRRGNRRLAARAWSIAGRIFGSTHADLEARAVALQTVFTPLDDQDGVLCEFTHQDIGAMQNTSRVQQEFVRGAPYDYGALIVQSWQVGLVAHDPRNYGATLISERTSDIATGGGLVFPMTFPMTFNHGFTGGELVIPAGGNYTRPARLMIFGPATNPIVEQVDGDLYIAFEDLAIDISEVVVIDTDEQTAVQGLINSALYSSVVLSHTPAAYWRLGDSTATAVDATGNLHDATLFGGYTQAVDGALPLDDDAATDFNGSTGYAQAPFAASLNPAGSFSITALALRDSIGTDDTIIDCISANTGFRLEVTAANKLRATVGTGGGTTSITGATTVAAGSYYHASVTYDGSSLRLYLNGVSDAAPVVTAYVANAVNPTRIAARNGSTNFFDGKLDEVAVYPELLIDTDVILQYSAALSGLISESNVYGSLDFTLTRFANLPNTAVTLRLRGSSVNDPAFLQVETRDSYV